MATKIIIERIGLMEWSAMVIIGENVAWYSEATTSHAAYKAAEAWLVKRDDRLFDKTRQWLCGEM